MIGTLFSLLLAGLFIAKGGSPEEGIAPFVKGIMTAVALSFLFLPLISIIASWLPLQKGEQNTTPRLLEMFRSDGKLRWEAVWLLLFSLATLAAAVGLVPSGTRFSGLLLPVWIVTLGVTVDVAWSFIHRILNYFNPFSVVKMFTARAKKSILSNHELDLCDWIDALSEVTVKAVERHSSSIAGLSLDELYQVASLFLDASKSIAHTNHDKQTEMAGITDKVSYTMHFLYQRIDIIFYKALKNRLEPVCSKIMTLLGKIAIAAAKYDMSLASEPLRVLGKCAKRAQDAGFEETALTASCVLSEVARTIIKEIDVTYYEIKDPFLSIINGLEVLTQEQFRKDKSVSILLLMQPFKDLKQLFQSDKVKNHQDTPVILQNIDRVLGEYEALMVVMNTIPEIPRVSDEPDLPGATK